MSANSNKALYWYWSKVGSFQLAGAELSTAQPQLVCRILLQDLDNVRTISRQSGEYFDNVYSTFRLRIIKTKR